MTVLTLRWYIPAPPITLRWRIGATQIAAANNRPIGPVDALPVVAGPVGLKGDKGDPGERGLQGLKGDKGDNGAAGSDAAVTSANVRPAMLAGGDLPVRYDALQPEIDCLWIAPTGRVVLITGS